MQALVFHVSPARDVDVPWIWIRIYIESELLLRYAGKAAAASCLDFAFGFASFRE